MNLKHLVDAVLLADTKKLARQEREIMSQVLHYMCEIDRRKLFADLGFSSMFAYATTELKYSPDQAQRRISACRMLAELPQIEQKLDDGSLNLTVLGMANSFFKENNCGTEEKQNLLAQIEGKSKKEVEIILAPELPPAPVNGTTHKYSKTQTKVTLILDDAVVEKLKELQALFSHTKKRNLPELLDFLCTNELAKQTKASATVRTTHTPTTQTPATQTPATQTPTTQTPTTQIPTTQTFAKRASRAIPASIKKEVRTLAKGKCQHPLCHSRNFLQIHHIIPYAEGGLHTSENLKLLCQAHHARGHLGFVPK
ncbi:MAG: HNH endonuclease signature motif containing protein [bacterium]|nr:HNH endonuclease signature motif containing protein [bacterium]